MLTMLNSDQLLTAIRERIDHPSTARELLQRLKIPRDQRATVKRLLKGLVDAGHLIKTRGNRFGLPDRPVEGLGGDIFIAGANLNQAMHGDRVVARIERTSGDRAEGRIVRILERGASSIVGRFDVDESGMGF